MATKTISLRKASYDRLRSLKKNGESFSDVIDRLAKPKSIRDFYGVLSDEAAERLSETSKRFREELDDGFGPAEVNGDH